MNNFHYGLRYVLDHSEEEVQDAVKMLAKRNRMAREEALEKASMQKLKRQLQNELNTAFGKAIEKELGRRFRRLYQLRMKA
ncbi:MAG: hypothetical protein ACTSYJ_00560 [Candidatus Thorarchaeota archaeon]